MAPVSFAYSDLDRPPLSERALRTALIVDGGLWTDLRYRQSTGSTNADVAAAARDGAPEGLVIVADEQTAGRGRLDRVWTSPPAAGIAVSLLLRPGTADQERGRAPVPVGRYGHLPLLAGVALAESVSRLSLRDAELKWPNDLLIDDRKCAGLLAETVAVPGQPPAVVMGIGLNVTLRAEELPRPDATSLWLVGSACTDRDPLLRALLRAFAVWYGRWREAGGDAVACGLMDAYRQRCATIGRSVRAHLPGGTEIAGEATGVDDDGRLVVAGEAIAAGDVVHLRPQ